MSAQQATEALVDLAAFESNLTHIRSVIAPARLMVVLKANAYGHGRVQMGRAAVAAGIRDLGVLDLDTGMALREAGIGSEVRLLAWLYPPGQDLSAAVGADIDLGVSTIGELRRVGAAVEAGRPVRVHLKIDTGLNRNGARAEDWPDLVQTALDLQAEGLVRVQGAWTHIAEASEQDDTLALERFSRAVQIGRSLGARFAVRHLAASSAGLRRADVRFEMVRMGGHCWGIPSFDGVTPQEIGLTPVMTLVSEVASVRDTGSERRAFVPVGFAAGVPSAAAGRVGVAIGGMRHPVVSVARDFIEVVVDSEVQVGDAVVLFGTGSRGEETVRQWGDAIGTLGDEIVTRIAASVPRRYLPTAGG